MTGKRAFRACCIAAALSEGRTVYVMSMAQTTRATSAGNYTAVAFLPTERPPGFEDIDFTGIEYDELED